MNISDGGSITWYKPTPVMTTSNPAEVLPPGIVHVYEGSSATLNWNYSLSLGLGLGGFVRFNNIGIVDIYRDGSTGPVSDRFQRRFIVSSTLGRISLSISAVTVADDKADGEFSCSLIDAKRDTWKRAIQVQVLVPAKITGIKGAQTVHEGSNLQLACEASGRPEPNITWVKQMAGNQGNTGAQEGGMVLTIIKISRSDSGTFICTAYNGFGEPDSQAVYVNVTYPATIAKFETEYFVGVQQSVTLHCEAEGNPQPTSYSWIPCDTEQVCDTNTLAIAQVFNDASYTCRVVNVHGHDTKTAIVYIAGDVINITIVIASENCMDEKYNKSLLLRKLDEELKRAFAGKFDYERVHSLSVRCGILLVDLALKFNSTTKERDVIIILNDAVKNGKLGEFSVGAIKGKRPDVKPPGGGCADVESSGGGATSPPDGSSGVFGSVVALTAAGLLVWWACRKRRRNRKGTEEVVMSGRAFGNSSDERDETTSIAVEMPKPSQSRYTALDDRTRLQVMADASPLSSEEISEYASLNSCTRSWEIAREHVTIKQIVGKGAFGQVAKATASNLQGRAEKTLVAVKLLKENASESERKDLLSELELMKKLKPHPYVIRLLGCVTKSEPLLVLIEYVPFGDLLGYLRKSRGLNDSYYKDPDIKPQTNLTSQQLMKFAWQIADGMSYLSSIPVIHRDLAARNVLVGEEETCKVTDFGMARDVQEDNIYERKTRGRLPVKWTAVEALLYGKYSTKSDVYDIMTKCWKDDPNLRPSFENLRNELKEVENQHKGLINLKNYDDRLYVNVDDLAE
ncbi:Tyrosine kinase receptor Cad96Ca [Stylophora pistillata]|uniref:receptor protein-tyrosine kinase n=1 Tax=Stylophora pistillata TaxID=50429 RepID=A0A2B4RDD1_STYPI|nr:Tyrosine kinase receptor Cad96Ca [Stylophora pistillata]